MAVKDVELLDPAAHKDLKAFQAWLTRNAKTRLSEGVRGKGEVLNVRLRLNTTDLRREGGLFDSRWKGTVAAEVDFFAADGTTSVARLLVSSAPSANGYLEAAGDRMIDDILEFISARE